MNLHARLAFLHRELAATYEQLAKCEPSDWIDQKSSPLGRRRHIELIRSGALPGKRVGRRYIARRSDVEAYLASVGEPAPAPPASEPDEFDRMLRDMGARRTA